jgi:ElaA protein
MTRAPHAAEAAGAAEVTGAAQAATASATVPTRTHDGWVLARTDQLSPLELYGILQLRSRVFVVEQECLYTDLDGLDLLPGTQHLLLPADEPDPRPAADAHGGTGGWSSEPLAYTRILPLEVADGPAARAGARSVGRVVTSPDGRGRGLGRRLLDEVVRLFGHGDLTLNAQSHLRDYYGRAGFRVSGPEFLEDGIPHLPMFRPGAATHA